MILATRGLKSSVRFYVLKGPTKQQHQQFLRKNEHFVSLVSSFQEIARTTRKDHHLNQLQLKNHFLLANIALPFSTLPNAGYTLIENNNQKQLPPKNDSILNKSNHRPHLDRSVPDLLQSLFVFELCKLKVLVRNGEKILRHSRAILGRRFTELLIRNTFFKQFCGGENHLEVSGKIRALSNSGIGVILDYAVEDEEYIHDKNGSGDHDIISEKYDRRLSKFLQCIEVSRDSPNNRKFVAVKLTSLGSSSLLQRMATFANDAHIIFSSCFDKDGKGYMTRDEFADICQNLSISSTDVIEAMKALDPQEKNAIDHIDMSMAAFGIISAGKSEHILNKLLSDTIKLSKDEQTQIKDMYTRLQKLVEKASLSGVCLLIDAEQSWFQPAIDVITIQLQQTYNKLNITNYPIIFNTYQCYLRDASERVKRHYRRSQCHGYHFGTKLVRGAYMQGENERAEKNMYTSPIHSLIQDTHNCYKEVIEDLMQHMVSDDKEGRVTLEVVCATHNQESIEYVIGAMDKLDLSQSTRDKIYFAQLYGMSDDLTIPLGKAGYNVYKYLPYGEIHEVIPYMLRRAQENGDVLGKSNHEKQLIVDELKARFNLI